MTNPNDSEWLKDLDRVEAMLLSMSEFDRNDAIEALQSRFAELYTRDNKQDA